MFKIICDIITPPIKQLAEELKCSPAFACTLSSVWKSKTGNTRYPTLQEAQQLLKSEQGIVNSVQTAVPTYSDGNGNIGKAAPFDSKKPLASSSNGQIVLRYLPEENPMEYFFDYITGKVNSRTSKQKAKVFEKVLKSGYTLDDIKELLSTTKEVYQFLLWHEMSHIQYQDALNYWNVEKGKNPNWDSMTDEEKELVKDYLTDDKIAIETRATIDALVKAKAYRKTHPKQFTSEVQSEKPKATELGPDTNNFTNSAETVSTQELNEVQNLANTDKNVVRTFGEDIAIQKDNAVKQQEKVYVTPAIGTEVLNVDLNNPIAKLSRDFNAIERHDVVLMLSRQFTSIVDGLIDSRLSEINSQILEESSKEDKDIDLINSLSEEKILMTDPIQGRRKAIQSITLESIFEQMQDEYAEIISASREDLESTYGENTDYVVSTFQKILDNFDLLLDEACIYIESAENIRIIPKKHKQYDGKQSTEVIGGQVEESIDDAEQREEQLNDDENGNRADGNGGWSFKVRFVDPLKTLSKDVKRVLSNIQEVNHKGEPQEDFLGNPKYLNAEVAHSILLNELSGMVTADDFSSKSEDGIYQLYALEKASVKYPWIKQVIEELKENPTLISSFYANFRKDFINYWMQRENKIFSLNAPNVLDSTISKITRTYEQGITLTDKSLYGLNNRINKDNIKYAQDLADSILSTYQEYEESDSKDVSTKVSELAKILGLDIQEYMVESMLANEETFNDVFTSVRSMKNILNGIDTMPEGTHLITYFNQDYKVIATNLGEVTELDNVTSFRQGDKTYPSYSAPNYIDTMFKSFKNKDKRQSYIDSQYKRFSWFYDSVNEEWNNEWLRLLETDENVANAFDMRELNNIDGIEYDSWTPNMIKPSFIQQYFSLGYDENSPYQYAWYNTPIFSDSPVVKFIKFVRYTSDENGTFKDKLLPLLRKVVKQELERIKLVESRRKLNVSTIANFDKNGDKFHFFPELNSLKYNGVSFLDAIKESTNMSDIDNLIDTALNEVMDSNFKEFLNSNINIEELSQSLLDSTAITDADQVMSALEEYFWNHAFATSQIIQLTTTDLAYYKDGVDFQKRYKEVYAAGTKLNTNSPYGRKIEKTIYLSDYEITSRTYNNIKRILLDAKDKGHVQSYDVDSILHAFKKVNVADAQAYRSLSSLRAVLDMMGAWTEQMQTSFDRLKSGDWDMSDYNTVWQTIKPFVFTQIEKSDGLGGILKVPHQNKNSEFLLLTMYNLLSSKRQSPIMKAVNEFMENNDIDVVQFESAVKAGKQGCIDLTYSPKRLSEYLKSNNLEDMSYSDFKKYLDNKLDRGSISQEEYNDIIDSISLSYEETMDILNEYTKLEDGTFNPDVVHEIPYDDYVVQQPTPEHLFDAVAVFGSQFRNLIISDITDEEGFTIDINGNKYTKKEVLNLYQSLIVENLLEDWSKLKGKFENIETFQKSLMEQVKGNPKYGRDMANALQLIEIIDPVTDEKKKVFNIPLHNPSTTNKLQELVNSMFKNAITKQSIKGGNCILVSNFGYTDQLDIVYNEDGSIKYLECYLPATSKKFYEPFIKEDGTLDYNKMPEDLKHLIGYRIPTENKYSMAALRIKGFLPQQNGSSIMLPAEITAMSGADFDVKLY